MQVENINIDELKPFKKNPMVHSEDQIKRIVRSISEFGFTNPILALKENKMIVAGHARLKAAQQMNLKEVPCILLDMPYEKAIAYVVADNQLARLAEYDNTMLLPLLEEIKLSGVDVELTGFTAADISFMNKKEVEEDDFDAQAAADAIKEPVTKLGDIWILGRHRLLCGDSTKKEDVERLMGGEKADMVFTDPPYGVSIGAKNRMLNSFQKAGRNLTDIKDDSLSPKELYDKLLPAIQNLKAACSDTCTVFATAPQGGELGMMMMVFKDGGLPIRHVLIWKKNSPTFSMGRLDYDYAHEPILLTWTKRHKFYGAGSQRTSVWEIDKPREAKEHPTMKPLALIANALLNNSIEDNLILDIYGGSGSTMMASEQLKRVCYMMELEPLYCDVICQRYEKMTGIKPLLQEAAP